MPSSVTRRKKKERFRSFGSPTRLLQSREVGKMLAPLHLAIYLRDISSPNQTISTVFVFSESSRWHASSKLIFFKLTLFFRFLVSLCQTQQLMPGTQLPRWENSTRAQVIGRMEFRHFSLFFRLCG